jgi:hypothetical protein
MKYKGFVLAAVQLAIVGSLAAKFRVDRETQPRVWARAMPYDPNLPIRGRYVSLQLRIEDVAAELLFKPVTLQRTADGKLTVIANPDGDPSLSVFKNNLGGFAFSQPIAYFIPEHVADPSIRPPGEELWVEVTIPRKGPPRPIQLGVKKDGVLQPLPMN